MTLKSQWEYDISLSNAIFWTSTILNFSFVNSCLFCILLSTIPLRDGAIGYIFSDVSNEV